ncbi:MEDS domain-containing protein [Nocardioides pocheonensis]|uniref:MEDS domain-containing protein n=1 Tax=Nocardioides pocheonensis TaxID=661485 RepID=A0A3N0GIA9_9ACTN|nr:MEDS domain-containing protein [Nocardioides pocheonensis]RNM12203.1 hypothetical protein EFL26_20595 [Nocardioides pocheonensis]
MPSEILSTVQVGGLELSPGDHVCAFYPTKVERDEILLPYLVEGMHAGAKCIAVLDADDGADIVDELAAALGPEIPAPDQLALHTSGDTYLATGSFSTDAMLDFWEKSVGGAFEHGFSFARVAGEMTWALSKLPGVEQLVGYEAKLNRFLPRFPQVILCLYELERFDGEVLVDVLKTHPKVLLGGMLLANPYYIEPDEFLASREP